MKILFIGSMNKQTYSYLTYKTLKQKYKFVDTLDTDKIPHFKKIITIIHFHIHPKIIEFFLNYSIKQKIKKKYDLIFIVTGELFGRNLLQYFKKDNSKLIFLCLDNPFFNRDKNKWLLTLPSLNLYDLIIFQQRTRIKYAKKFKLKYALVPPLYNKDIHSPQHKIKKERKYKRNVLIVGTWFYDRGVFVKKLISYGLKPEIYGDHWNKDLDYSILKKYIKGKGVLGKDYSRLIFFSKIVISFPNTHNDDDITNKSLEVPAVGSVLLTSNSKSHREIFNTSIDAVLFNNPRDCYNKCQKLLSNKNLIKKISIAGHKKITSNKKFDYKTNLIALIEKII
tara:strand:- start:95 stop:1105 length:1011 start_codon:yes stop_codon:yes gene_type:complete